MGRKNAKVTVATWEVSTYLLAEDRLLEYLDSGLDAQLITDCVPGLSAKRLREAVVVLLQRLRKGADSSHEGYYEVQFDPALVDFFWVTHRFVFDREYPGKVNHPLEVMGLPYYVALWGLAERIRIWNNTAVKIEYVMPSL